MSVGQRKDFLSGLLANNAARQTRTNFNNSLISHRKNKRSQVELPGIGHQIGSLNGVKRKNEFHRVSK